MGFARVRSSQRIARTLDGGYLYRDVVYRSAPGGMWEVESPEGFTLLVGSQEKAQRAIDGYLDQEG